MRRKDREVVDRAPMDDVLSRATTISLAMVDKGAAYVVPLSFGYDGAALYVHGAPDGRKIAALRAHPRVCFTAVTDQESHGGATACDYGVRARSVIGTGVVEFIADAAAKRRAFDLIMRHYAAGEFTYPDAMVERTAVFKIVVDSLTMKSIGYPRAG